MAVLPPGYLSGDGVTGIAGSPKFEPYFNTKWICFPYPHCPHRTSGVTGDLIILRVGCNGQLVSLNSPKRGAITSYTPSIYRYLADL